MIFYAWAKALTRKLFVGKNSKTIIFFNIIDGSLGAAVFINN